MKIYTYKGKKNLCGDRIRIERLKKRMTQMELAAKIQLQGITLERDSISRIEIGTRFVTDYELKLFAKVLNVRLMICWKKMTLWNHSVFSLQKSSSMSKKRLTYRLNGYII